MKNKKTSIAFALAAVFILSLSIMVTAYRGNFEEKGPDCSEDRHELVMDAFDELDYEAWKALMTENGRSPGVLRLVNEKNFDVFVEAHRAGKAGDLETANRLRAEIGFNNGEGPRNGEGFGKSEGLGEMKMKGHGQGAGGAHMHKSR